MQEQPETIPVLYGPRDGKALKKLYPELEAIPALKGMASDEVLYAWYIGIPNSPVSHDWPEPTRYKSAALKSFPNNEEKRRKYADFEVTTEVRLAIEEFKKKSPEARYIANVATQNNFNNILKNSKVDIETDFFYWDKDGNKLIDWSARKQYMDTIKLTSEILPGLLKQLEDGFGITEKKKDEITMGNKSIDKYHADKKDRQ